MKDKCLFFSSNLFSYVWLGKEPVYFQWHISSWFWRCSFNVCLLFHWFGESLCKAKYSIWTWSKLVYLCHCNRSRIIMLFFIRVLWFCRNINLQSACRSEPVFCKRKLDWMLLVFFLSYKRPVILKCMHDISEFSIFLESWRQILSLRY